MRCKGTNKRAKKQIINKKNESNDNEKRIFDACNLSAADNKLQTEDTSE
jgi:hypothetical protein